MTVKLRMAPITIDDKLDGERLKRVLRDLQLSQEARTFMEHVVAVVARATMRHQEITLSVHCQPGGRK